MAVRMRHHLGAVMPELRWEPTPMRVRALVGGDVVVDSNAALLVWEPRRLVPVYAVPLADLTYGATPTSPQPDPLRGDDTMTAKIFTWQAVLFAPGIVNSGPPHAYPGFT